MGKKVRCIDNGDENFNKIKVGDVYEVDHEAGDYYYLVDTDPYPTSSSHGPWFKWRFENVEENLPTAPIHTTTAKKNREDEECPCGVGIQRKQCPYHKE